MHKSIRLSPRFPLPNLRIADRLHESCTRTMRLPFAVIPIIHALCYSVRVQGIGDFERCWSER